METTKGHMDLIDAATHFCQLVESWINERKRKVTALEIGRGIKEKALNWSKALQHPANVSLWGCDKAEKTF